MRATDIVRTDLPQLARVEAHAFYTALGYASEAGFKMRLQHA